MCENVQLIVIVFTRVNESYSWGMVTGIATRPSSARIL